jgi:hypothetical protein
LSSFAFLEISDRDVFCLSNYVYLLSFYCQFHQLYSCFYFNLFVHLVILIGGVPSQICENRKRRWDGLNAVLDINKKAKHKDGRMSLGYSYANWEQVKEYFHLEVGTLPTASGEGLPQSLLTALHQYLSFATICFGSISEGHEAKRVHFIAPIIIIVCSYFNGDIQILAEEEIEGNRVHAHSHFEFVLKRRDKRICIVEAKKDDILQGKTQSLVGCESLCDVEDLSVSYGIATNYLEWCFLKDEADKITEEMLTVSLEKGRPTIESIRTIANKIIAILE